MTPKSLVGIAALGAIGLVNRAPEHTEAAATVTRSSTTDQFEIWPSRELPAGARTFSLEEVERIRSREAKEHISFVEYPSLTVHKPMSDKMNGCAIVVAPGGGYNLLAIDKEGTEIAERLTVAGITAFVLKYRVPQRPDANGAIHTEPLQDMQRAIRLVRHRAAEWGIDPERIGALGFSAGGHLAFMAGMHFEEATYAPIDDVDAISARPDFLCPIYAAYLGPDYGDDEAQLGPLVKVTKDTPPAFMAVTLDDRARGAQAALMLVEYFKAGVAAELHTFAKGGHGYGLRPTGHPVNGWADALEDWLHEMKLLGEGR